MSFSKILGILFRYKLGKEKYATKKEKKGKTNSLDIRFPV
jgi:hypothetical protein